MPFLASLPAQTMQVCGPARYAGLFEIFTAADHGSTLEYRLDSNGCYEPVLRSPGNIPATTWGLYCQQQAILAFTAELLQVADRNYWSLDGLRNVTTQLLHLFFTQPSQQEAETYGAFQFSESQSEESFLDLAPPISLAQFGYWFLTGRLPGTRSLWIEGSIRRSNLPGALRMVNAKQAAKHGFSSRG